MTADKILDQFDDEVLEREAAIKLLLGHPEVQDSHTAESIGDVLDRMRAKKRGDQEFNRRLRRIA